jgi:hypothetical protein
MTNFCILISPTREAIRGFLKAHAKNAKQSQVLENIAAVALGVPKTPLFVHLDHLAAVVEHADNCAL